MSAELEAVRVLARDRPAWPEGRLIQRCSLEGLQGYPWNLRSITSAPAVATASSSSSKPVAFGVGVAAIVAAVGAAVAGVAGVPSGCAVGLDDAGGALADGVGVVAVVAAGVIELVGEGKRVGVGVTVLLPSPPPPPAPPLGGSGVAVAGGVGHVTVPPDQVTVRSPVSGSFNLLGGAKVTVVTQSRAVQHSMVRLPMRLVPLTVGCPSGLMKTSHSRPSLLESHVPCHCGPYSTCVTLIQPGVYVRFI